MSGRWRRLRCAGSVLLAIVIGCWSAASATADDSMVTLDQEQDCIAAGLARPTVTHPLAMHRAGIRPGTPGRYLSQGTSGVFFFPALPEGCKAYTRSMGSKLEMRRGQWATIGTRNAEQPGNGERYVTLSDGPTHAWPDYVFNECVGGKGWLKVRAVLMVRVRNAETKQLLGEQRYVFPAKVYGSCKAARQSAKATEDYEEEWGAGSGTRRAGFFAAAEMKQLCIDLPLGQFARAPLAQPGAL